MAEARQDQPNKVTIKVPIEASVFWVIGDFQYGDTDTSEMVRARWLVFLKQLSDPEFKLQSLVENLDPDITDLIYDNQDNITVEYSHVQEEESLLPH